jgi:hypothetical protein
MEGSAHLLQNIPETEAHRLMKRMLLAKISIRLMGEGIETPMKSLGELKLERFKIGKLEKGVPFMDTCELSMTLYTFV